MQLLKSLLKSQTTYKVAFAFLIIYVGLRAALVNMTHDEAWSFHNVKNFWYVEFLCTGNSHWLNSLGMKLSLILGSETVFCLRWLSIISFILTCCFGLWWIKSLENTSIKLLAFCLIFLNPYLLDYFGLARGYASGIMFQCLSILFFIRGISNHNRLTLFSALAFSGLSAISNYSFVYFYFGFALVYFFELYFKNGITFLKNRSFYIDLFFTLGITSLIIRAFVFMIRCSGDFIGAGEPSFLSMFHVFSDGLLYYKITFSKLTQYGISLLVSIIAAVSCFYGIFKKKEHLNNIFYYVSLILTIMLITMVVNYFCFHIVYPFYRAAQLLFIPVYIVVVSLINFKLSSNKFIAPGIFAFCFLLIINFTLSANLKYTFDFKEQADSESCFNIVEKLNAKKVGISPELYGVFANYYQMSETKRYPFVGDFINTWWPQGFCPIKNKLTEFDYIILFPPYDLSYYKNTEVQFEVIHLSPTTKTLILKVEKKPLRP